MANSRMAHDKSGMGCRSFSNRMHNTLLFSNPSWMATKTRCKKRRSMNNGLPTTYINTCPAIFVSPCKRNYQTEKRAKKTDQDNRTHAKRH